MTLRRAFNRTFHPYRTGRKDALHDLKEVGRLAIELSTKSGVALSQVKDALISVIQSGVE